jgi:hypothetical protein
MPCERRPALHVPLVVVSSYKLIAKFVEAEVFSSAAFGIWNPAAATGSFGRIAITGHPLPTEKATNPFGVIILSSVPEDVVETATQPSSEEAPVELCNRSATLRRKKKI